MNQRELFLIEAPVVAPPERVRWTARRWFDVIHRWLGFTCGAILLIAGLTGTLLSFYIEFERTFYPHMQVEKPHAVPSSYEDVYTRLSRLPREAPGFWRIEIPPDGGPITSRYAAQINCESCVRTRMVTLDPTTLQVMRDARWHETFFTWIYDLHMYLLIVGPAGRIVMGTACILMLVMLISGVVIWLMPWTSMALKLHFKRPANIARRTYDIHKLAGIITLLLLMLCVGTGAILILNAQVRPLLNSVSPLKPADPGVLSIPFEGAQRIPVDKAIAIGHDHFPGSRVVWVKVPSDPTQAYDVQLRQAGAPMTRFPRTHLWLDQYTGRVLAVYDPRNDGLGDTVLNWLVPLHDGKAFGMFGRVMVMLLGLMPLVLFVTGLMRWSQKRTMRMRRNGRLGQKALDLIEERM